MKIDLKIIVDGIEMQTNESQTFFNTKSGKILLFTDEELEIAESKQDISEYVQWMQDAINNVRKYLEEQDDYIELPTEYEFHEYHVMEKFILSLPHESQREELYYSIKGKGAFAKFKHGLERYSLTDEWYKYRDKAVVKLAKNWCDENAIEVNK